MIESTENKVVYEITADGGLEFSFPYPYFDKSDLHCYILHNDAETELRYGTDFQVVEGNVILTSRPAIGAKLTIAREMAVTQSVNLPLNGKLPSTALERQLDKIIMICQQFMESLNRTLQVPKGMETYDNVKTYNAFRTMVDNIETWVDDVKSNKDTAVECANAAGISAESAEKSAGAAERSAGAAGSSANTSESYALESERHAIAANGWLQDIREISDQADLNKVSIDFGWWGQDNALLSFNDWTNVSSITTTADQIERHNHADNSHEDIRELIAEIQNELSLLRST